MELDHVTLRTRDVVAAEDFLCAVFDVEAGPRPASLRRIPGCWLYAGGRPLIHVVGTNAGGRGESAEAIDHVGFRMSDHAGFRSRLDRLGIRYTEVELPDIRERRLFLRMPGGPLLETVFAAPEPDPDDPDVAGRRRETRLPTSSHRNRSS